MRTGVTGFPPLNSGRNAYTGIGRMPCLRQYSMFDCGGQQATIVFFPPQAQSEGQFGRLSTCVQSAEYGLLPPSGAER